MSVNVVGLVVWLRNDCSLVCILVNQVWNFAKETVNYTHQVVFATSSKLLPQNLSGDWISITTRSARVRVRVRESEYCKSLK